MSLIRSTVIATLTALAVIVAVLFVLDLLSTSSEADRQLCRAVSDAASCR